MAPCCDTLLWHPPFRGLSWSSRGPVLPSSTLSRPFVAVRLQLDVNPRTRLSQSCDTNPPCSRVVIGALPDDAQEAGKLPMFRTMPKNYQRILQNFPTSPRIPWKLLTKLDKNSDGPSTRAHPHPHPHPHPHVSIMFFHMIRVLKLVFLILIVNAWGVSESIRASLGSVK